MRYYAQQATKTQNLMHFSIKKENTRLRLIDLSTTPTPVPHERPNSQYFFQKNTNVLLIKTLHHSSLQIPTHFASSYIHTYLTSLKSWNDEEEKSLFLKE